MAFVFADFVNGADVGMVERRRSTRLAPEAFKRLGILGDAGRKKFEGDKAAESDVFGLIDDTHATATQLFDHAVMGDGFAEHAV